jgi:hypothetical protein
MVGGSRQTPEGGVPLPATEKTRRNYVLTYFKETFLAFVPKNKGYLAWGVGMGGGWGWVRNPHAPTCSPAIVGDVAPALDLERDPHATD